METSSIQDWGDAFMTSLTGALAIVMAAIPKVIAFILILLIGWFIAGLVAKGVAALLRTIKFNEFAQRAGLNGFSRSMGANTDSAGILAGVVKWFILLITLVVAFDGLGLPAVSDFLRQVLLWIPNLFVALVVLVIGGLAANALSKFVKGVADKAGIENANVLATVASVGVWAFTIIVVVNQIGVGVALVNTLFMGTVGALALAIGLAFGLGGRETAGKIVEEWYIRGKQAKPDLAAVGEAAKQQGRQVKEEVQQEAQRVRSSTPRTTPR